MKIGYDAKRAFLNNTGLGNYSRWLIKVMATYHPQYSYYLYTPKVKLNNRLDFLKTFKNIFTVAPATKLLRGWWRTTGILKDLKRDEVSLYHGLSHELPLGISKSGIKAVLTVHDLIFMRFPQYYGWINRKIYTAKLRYACKAADRIVAISQRTKTDLIELLQIAPEKVEIIYQGCDPVFSLHQHEAHKKAVSKKYDLPKKFLLCVGTIEERKNLLVLVKALLHTRNNMPLVVVGKPTPYLEKVKAFIDANQLTGRVLFWHDVSFADLPTFYQLATVFVYPSRYEGFGIPVLEALQSGVPVIAASGSCLEEAGGPHSLYFHPDDDVELAKKINQVWNSPSLRQQMIVKGFEYGHNFEDEKLAEQYMHIYQKTMNHA